MPFGNPVVSGTALTRSAIRSPNYVVGVRGWTINRDGTAEFLDVLVRGELFVSDVDGSYIRIYDENPGNGAVVALNPADIPGSVITPAQIFTNSVAGAPDEVSITISGPGIDGFTGPFLDLRTDNVGVDLAEIGADRIEFQTEALVVYDSNGTPGLEVFPNQPADTYLAVDGKTLGFGYGAVNATPPAADTETSATFQTIGATSLAITKKRAETRLELRMDLGLFSTAGGTQGQYGLRHAGGDITLGQFNLSAPSQEVYPGATVLVSGLAAGAYTFTPIWRRTAGAGTLTITAVSGTLSYSAREIIEP